MKLKKRSKAHPRWGYADFFNDRQKLKILKLAEITKSDVLYDMGCGDASFLIFAVKNFGVRAIGFENMPRRFSIANKNIRDEGLENMVTINDDMYEADLSEADIILDMMPEGEDDLDDLYSQKIRRGTKLIKHDLPLVGYLPDKIDYPFYRMTFPLRKARSKNHWSESVLERKNTDLSKVWHELYYYDYEKTYDKREINTFRKLLGRRIS